MKKMRSRVIPHGGLANVRVDDRIDFVAHPNRLFGDDLMRPHPLNRVIASLHFSNDGVVIVGVNPSAVAHLPAGLGIERGVIKNDLARLASLEFLRPLAILDDGQHFAIFRASLPISFKIRFRQLLIGRIGGLLRRAFPRCASPLALRCHCTIEASLVKAYSQVATRILDEISGQPESVIKLERLFSRKGHSYASKTIKEVNCPRDCCCNVFLFSSTGP